MDEADRMARELIRDLIPQAPHLGLFISPDIPSDLLQNAISDYAKGVRADAVIALYDATLKGNGKDGALFLRDHFVFQNNNLEPTHTIRYRDLVEVREKHSLFTGKKIELLVNQARATVSLKIDFSGKPKAAGYVSRFLNEVLIRGAAEEMDEGTLDAEWSAHTNVRKVTEVLRELVRDGHLSRADYEKLLRAMDA